jgi:hypothetical protein
MRTQVVLGSAMVALAMALSSCGPEPAKTKSEAPKQAAPKVADESRRFPAANLVETKVVERALLNHEFMPGGTIGHYKKGSVEYDLFVARVADANAAALMLPDWRNALTGARLVPSFGGYFGIDAGRPVFVFSKGAWIAGVAGLSEKDADGPARMLASRLD